MSTPLRDTSPKNELFNSMSLKSKILWKILWEILQCFFVHTLEVNGRGVTNILQNLLNSVIQVFITWNS